MKYTLVMLAATLVLCTSAKADFVSVSITGTVIFNGISDPPLSGVGFGQTANMSFTVDSNVFMDGIPGDTRGYEIIPSSFSLAFDTINVGLLNPLPGTAYFTLVDGFPVSDGFFVATSNISPGGVPLEQEPYFANVDLGYTGNTLSSLDILDAVGVYDFGGLTRFSYSIWTVFPDNSVMEMDFQQLTISRQIPEPASVGLFTPLGLLIFSRRHKRQHAA
jgi:hypothetical protein